MNFTLLHCVHHKNFQLGLLKFLAIIANCLPESILSHYQKANSRSLHSGDSDDQAVSSISLFGHHHCGLHNHPRHPMLALAALSQRVE